VPPFVVVQENPAIPRGVNIEGIRRRGFTADDISQIKQAYRLLFMSDLPAAEAREQLAELATRSAPARLMHEFVANAKRLIQKGRET